MKSTRYIRIYHALAVIGLMAILQGCLAPSDEEAEHKAFVESQKVKYNALRKEIRLSTELQSILDKFPSPTIVATMLEETKASYFFDITNPPDNVTRYETEKSKAVNLGVYSADLSYSIVYNRLEETHRFFYCVNKLADELGVFGINHQADMDRLKKLSQRKDSVLKLTNALLEETKAFLSKNNRNQIEVLIVTGGFTEGLFIASALGEMATRDNAGIMAVINAQKQNYDNLMKILNAYQGDPEMKPVIDAMSMLKYLWTNFGIDSGKSIPVQKSVEIADLLRKVRDRIVNL